MTRPRSTSNPTDELGALLTDTDQRLRALELGAHNHRGAGASASSSSGVFAHYADQIAVASTPTPILLAQTLISEGVSVASSTQITFTYAGTYDVQFSAQVRHLPNALTGQNLIFWLRLNAVDIPNSARRLTVSADRYDVASWNFVTPVSANDYIELIWFVDNVNIQLEFEPAVAGPPAIPAIPSVIVCVSPVGVS